MLLVRIVRFSFRLNTDIFVSHTCHGIHILSLSAARSTGDPRSPFPGAGGRPPRAGRSVALHLKRDRGVRARRRTIRPDRPRVSSDIPQCFTIRLRKMKHHVGRPYRVSVRSRLVATHGARRSGRERSERRRCHATAGVEETRDTRFACECDAQPNTHARDQRAAPRAVGGRGRGSSTSSRSTVQSRSEARGSYRGLQSGILGRVRS